MSLVERIFDIIMEPLRNQVERDMDENGVPFEVWRFFFDKQQDLYWEFESMLSAIGRVSVPLAVYEAHSLFREEYLYAVNDPSDPTKVLLMDVETGTRMATVAGIYVDTNIAHSRSRVVQHPGGYGVIISTPLMDKMGLRPGQTVHVEAFPPDRDMPNGYIVISPKDEESSG